MPKILNNRWSIKHKECLECGNSDRKHEARGYCIRCYSVLKITEYRKKHKQKNYSILNKYKNAPYAKLDKCEICNKECKTVFDHNHKTGKFRGWICSQCNISIGLVKDKIEILQKMIIYLVKN